MTDGMVGLLPLVLFFNQLNGQQPKRAQGFLSHRYACYNTYETADGRFISIGAVEKRFWRQLCDVLGVSEYAELQYNEQHRKEIIDYMRKAFKRKTLDEWDAVLGDLEICWGRVQSLSEVLEDPLFRQRKMVVEIKGNDGKTSKTLGVPVKLSETPGAVRTPPVNFGASTPDILRELGYSEKEIKRFEKDGVV
jgi:crotonobetainyl-CoA:carnitine CoA-transferase CaiB-like acyl-CoA transferase